MLERLNAAILDEGARSRFLTLLYGELWPQVDGSALLKVVCAGHPLPLRLRQDGTVEPGGRAAAAAGRHGRPGAVRADGHPGPG
nr:SpoIIE family protein phosphatase [Streptomyces cinnamoneus]